MQINSSQKKIIVIGGGYAGLRAALKLSQNPEFTITVLDRKPYFLDILQLHRSIKTPLAHFTTPYHRLMPKNSLPGNIRFVHHKMDFCEQDLLDWQQNHEILLYPYDPQKNNPQKKATSHNKGNIGDNGQIDKQKNLKLYQKEKLFFDHLIVTAGARPHACPELCLDSIATAENFFTLDDFKSRTGNARWLRQIQQCQGKKPEILVVGGGPTAIQFVFELASLKNQLPGMNITLAHDKERLVQSLPVGFHEYIVTKLKQSGITLYCNAKWQPQLKRDQSGLASPSIDGSSEPIQTTISGHIYYKPTNKKIVMNPDLILWLAGVEPEPFLMRTDSYGHIIAQGQTLDHIWAAGDCSRFAGNGLNSMDAQAGVRKAALVASNIEHTVKGDALEKYNYQQLGFFISMGDWDGIGWMLFPFHTITGPPAFVVKEMIESQFKLFLQGFNSYLD